MKLTKLASLAAIGVVAALGVCSAKAASVDTNIVGTTSDYMRLTLSAVVQTNAPTLVITNSSTYISTIRSMVITSQKLLGFMADWNNTTWPTGAQLIFDWNSYEVCVADSTGTNILFYAGEGIHNGVTNAYMNVDWYYDGGVYNETYVDKTPGLDAGTDYYLGYFELVYNDGISSDYVDLYGYGPNMDVYNEHWTSTYDIGTEIEIFRMSGAGSLGNGGEGGNAVFNGIIIGSGHTSSVPE